jgi:DNA topoisomerase VI B subunit
LENFSLLDEGEDLEDSPLLNDDLKQTLMDEIKKGSDIPQLSEKEKPEEEEPPEEKKIKPKKKEEIEEIEVRKIVDDMESLIKPVDNINIIDKEPIVIVRLTETEAKSLLTGEIDAKNVMSYKFEVFDNGLGMSPMDLEKYGKYLASSKSMELKQTRGSQGFGAPSAFSDAQNTTGKPIVTVSKTADNLYAMASEYFTTSKNEKRYVVSPTEIDVPFLHGTYTQLHYLNIKYVRGYVDEYVKETALMNPHVTIIYIDPYNEEHIYPRKVSSFPAEPRYAKPHPSSTNIGDLQDLLAKSDHLSLTSFLQDNFVRISFNKAKEVVDLAERDLQDILNVLILDEECFITLTQKKDDKPHLLRYEDRVYGRSNKPREKLIPYKIISDELKQKYKENIEQYKSLNDEIEEINEKVKEIKSEIQEADTKKKQRKLKRRIRDHGEDVEGIRDQKDKVRESLLKVFKEVEDGLEEITTKKRVKEFVDLVNEVKITDANPGELTNEQFNSLFYAFKSVDYMSPPTDTVVPVGDVVLENTLIKELGLKVSENLDDFGTPVEEIKLSSKEMLKSKKNRLLKEYADLEKENLDEIELKEEEIINFNNKILNPLVLGEEAFESKSFYDHLDGIFEVSEESKEINYKQLFEYFVENFTREDDFVGAETRDPTSGKGLAYVVEGVLAYGNKLETPNRSRDVLSRFVNRTPKLRDTAGCAITKAVKSVNWKNYELDSFDNGLPKGPIKLLVNVSGPYVHLMFKSQSKNALAEDENLMDEIKYCLEAVGRRLRVYLNRRKKIRKKEKRANLIEKYIPKFVDSLYGIAQEGSKYKDQIQKEELRKLIKAPISKDIKDVREEIKLKGVKREEKSEKEVKEAEEEEEELEEIDYQNLEEYTVDELKSIANDKDIPIPSSALKADIIEIIQEEVGVLEKEEEEEEIEIKEVDYQNLEDYTVDELKSIANERDISISSNALKADIIETIQEEVGVLEKEEEEEEIEIKEVDYQNLEDYTVDELKSIANDKDIPIPSSALKADIIETIQEEVGVLEKEEEEEEEEIEIKEVDYENLEDYTVKELKSIADDKDISIPSSALKADIIEIIQKEVGLLKEEEEEKKKKEERITKKKPPEPMEKPKAPPTPSKTKQQKLPIITNDRILKALTKDDWLTIKQLIFKLRIKDMLDARLLQVKLKKLEEGDEVMVKTKKGKKYWKLK